MLSMSIWQLILRVNCKMFISFHFTKTTFFHVTNENKNKVCLQTIVKLDGVFRAFIYKWKNKTKFNCKIKTAFQCCGKGNAECTRRSYQNDTSTRKNLLFIILVSFLSFSLLPVFCILFYSPHYLFFCFFVE